MKLLLSKQVQGKTELMVHFFQCFFEDIDEIVADEWHDKIEEIEHVLYKRYSQAGMEPMDMAENPSVVCKIHADACTRVDTQYCTSEPIADGFSVLSPIEEHYSKAKGRKQAFARAVKMFDNVEERATLWQAYLKADPKVLREAA